MPDPNPVSREEVQALVLQRQHRVVGEFVLKNRLRRVLVLELVARRDSNEDHAVVKKLLFDLTRMAKDDARWLETVRTLRGALEEHMNEEENEHFPKLRAALSEQEDSELASAMNKEGLKVA